jgi:hypothetical protein
LVQPRNHFVELVLKVKRLLDGGGTFLVIL